MKTLSKSLSFLFFTAIICSFVSCKNFRISELENHLGFELEKTELIGSEENLDEFTGEKYFVSVYKISETDLNKITSDPTFLILENPKKLEIHQLIKYIIQGKVYLFKEIKTDNEISFLILDAEKSQLIFSKSSILSAKH